MPRETTPPKITHEIKHLCRKIAPKSNLILVPVKPAPDASLNECFPNVESMVKKYGGELASGWVIWQWANILIEAEAHAIWKSPNGDMIDITPHDAGEKAIFFLPDEKVIYAGTPIPSNRMALTKSKLVERFIQLYTKWDDMAYLGSVADAKLDIIGREMLEIRDKFHRPASRNSPCPCESGLKYKQCCGKYE